MRWLLVSESFSKKEHINIKTKKKKKKETVSTKIPKCYKLDSKSTKKSCFYVCCQSERLINIMLDLTSQLSPIRKGEKNSLRFP